MENPSPFKMSSNGLQISAHPACKCVAHLRKVTLIKMDFIRWSHLQKNRFLLLRRQLWEKHDILTNSENSLNPPLCVWYLTTYIGDYCSTGITKNIWQFWQKTQERIYIYILYLANESPHLLLASTNMRHLIETYSVVKP